MKGGRSKEKELIKNSFKSEEEEKVIVMQKFRTLSKVLYSKTSKKGPRSPSAMPTHIIFL